MTFVDIQFKPNPINPITFTLVKRPLQVWTPLIALNVLRKIEEIDFQIKTLHSLGNRTFQEIIVLNLPPYILNELLHIAAKRGYSNAELLIKAGADVNSVESAWNDTPLHHAAFYNQKEAVDLLLKYHADPNIRNNSGMTPIEIAVEKRNPDEDLIIQLLPLSVEKNRVLLSAFRLNSVIKACIDLNVNVNCETDLGYKAIECVAMIGNQVGVQLLLEAGSDTYNQAINLAVQSRIYSYSVPLDTVIAIAKMLIQKGCFVNEPTRNSRKMPVHDAIHNPPLLELLLQSGANPDVFNEERYTPLHMAQIEASVRLLVLYGADVNLATLGGQTSLKMAAERGLEKSAAILIEHGAMEL